MSENFLSLTVEQLFERLHGAVVGRDLRQVGAATQAVEQNWAFAVVRRDRAGTRLLGRKLLEIAATAAVAEDCPPHGGLEPALAGVVRDG